MNTLRRVLLYYSTLLTGFIIVTGVMNAESPESLALNLLFVPIGAFLLNKVYQDVRLFFKKDKAEENIPEPILGQKSFLVSAALLFILLIGISISGVGLAPEESTSVAIEEPVSNPIIVKTTPKPSPKKLVIDSEFGFVNIRSGPSVGTEIVKKALNGEEYEYTGTEDGWYQILLEDGKIGWATRRYITEIVEE